MMFVHRDARLPVLLVDQSIRKTHCHTLCPNKAKESLLYNIIIMQRNILKGIYVYLCPALYSTPAMPFVVIGHWLVLHPLKLNTLWSHTIPAAVLIVL